MPGIRVRHETLRNGLYTVEAGNQYPVPYQCPLCPTDLEGNPRVHIFKAHHIQLDNDGYGMVSEGVLELLQQVGMAGLTVENTVNDPPPLIVGGPDGNLPVVGEFVHPG